jgi:hypothetical protein
LRQPLVSGMPHHAVSPHLAVPAGPASARDPCAKGALSARTQGLRTTARRWGCVHAGSADGAFARVCAALGESAGGGGRFASSKLWVKERRTHTTCFAWPSSVFEVNLTEDLRCSFPPDAILARLCHFALFLCGRGVGVQVRESCPKRYIDNL